MDHRSEVKYANSAYVEVGETDLNGWVFALDAGGYGSASGTCPICQGTAYGPGIVDITEREPGPVLDRRVDVSCSCHCGFDHGGGAELGCGRWWIASSGEVPP
jgi:hypothetical protein